MMRLLDGALMKEDRIFIVITASNLKEIGDKIKQPVATPNASTKLPTLVSSRRRLKKASS